MAKHQPTFVKIGLTFDFDNFWGEGQGPQKPTIDPEKMTPRKNGCDF